MSEESKIRFIDNGDGTVTDTETNLMWKQTDAMQELNKWTNWHEAQDYIRDLNAKLFLGHADWRMPALKEAESLYDATQKQHIRDMDRFEIFIDPVFTPGGGHTTWTSSERPHGGAIIFYYRYGHANVNNKEDISRDTVRPVRTIKKA